MSQKKKNESKERGKNSVLGRLEGGVEEKKQSDRCRQSTSGKKRKKGYPGKVREIVAFEQREGTRPCYCTETRKQ